MIRFKCPACDRVLNAADHTEGRPTVCPCGTKLTVPGELPEVVVSLEDAKPFDFADEPPIITRKPKRRSAPAGVYGVLLCTIGIGSVMLAVGLVGWLMVKVNAETLRLVAYAVAGLIALALVSAVVAEVQDCSYAEAAGVTIAWLVLFPLAVLVALSAASGQGGGQRQTGTSPDRPRTKVCTNWRCGAVFSGNSFETRCVVCGSFLR